MSLWACESWMSKGKRWGNQSELNKTQIKLPAEQPPTNFSTLCKTLWSALLLLASFLRGEVALLGDNLSLQFRSHNSWHLSAPALIHMSIRLYCPWYVAKIAFFPKTYSVYGLRIGININAAILASGSYKDPICQFWSESWSESKWDSDRKYLCPLIQFWCWKDCLYEGVWSFSWEYVPHVLDTAQSKKKSFDSQLIYNNSLSLDLFRYGQRVSSCLDEFLWLFVPGLLFPKFFSSSPTCKYTVCSSSDLAKCFSFKGEFLTCKGAVFSWLEPCFFKCNLHLTNK